MCTSISYSNGGFCFGRNMDIEYSFDGRVVFTPRNFPFSFRRAGELSSHYAMIGTAAVADGYPLYADGMNEMGLCMAGLSLPESVYPDKVHRRPDEELREVAPFEFIPWVLGKCGNLGDVRALLKETALVNIPFSERLPLTPLHWHIADRSGSVAVECTAVGMRVYDDPAGVLTNSPELPFHLTDLRRYMSLTPAYPEPKRWGGIRLSPFGRGFGALGLPGDFSPPSRFVRAAFLLHNSPKETDELRQVCQLFHILDSVAMPHGAVYTEDGREESTLYSSCMYPESGSYYFRTYCGAVFSAGIRRPDPEADRLTEYHVTGSLPIQRLN